MYQTNPGFNENRHNALVGDSIAVFKGNRANGFNQLIIGSTLKKIGIGVGILLMIIGFVLMGILFIYPQPQPTLGLWILLCIFEVLSIITGSVIFAAGTIVETQAWGLIAMAEQAAINTPVLTDEEKYRLVARPIP
jgi:hypothetical protein